MNKFALLLTIIFCCSGCIKTYHTSGHLFKEDEIQALEKSKTKQEIEDLLGSPTTVSDFGKETWYYITSKKETIAFLPDKVIEQNIIAVVFDNDNVASILRYTENDKNEVDIISEYTVTKGNDISATQHLFTNLGRFNNNKTPEPAKPRSGF